jgi:uncharacterized cupredoxin-like copper-binding protein
MHTKRRVRLRTHWWSITRNLGHAALITFAFVSVHAHAHGDAHGKKPPTKRALQAEQKEFGIAGDRTQASRTIKFEAHDTMRFSPAQIEVKEGETIRFVIRNPDKLMHEMVIGTMKELKQHADLMKKFPDMEHDEAHMVHVAPGKTGEIIWTFNRPGTFHFACLIGGHFEAGMLGKITVAAK